MSSDEKLAQLLQEQEYAVAQANFQHDGDEEMARALSNHSHIAKTGGDDEVRMYIDFHDVISLHPIHLLTQFFKG